MSSTIAHADWPRDGCQAARAVELSAPPVHAAVARAARSAPATCSCSPASTTTSCWRSSAPPGTARRSPTACSPSISPGTPTSRRRRSSCGASLRRRPAGDGPGGISARTRCRRRWPARACCRVPARGVRSSFTWRRSARSNPPTAELASLQLDALVLCYGFDHTSTRFHRLAPERSAHAALVAEGAITNLLPITSSSALVDHAELIYRSYLDLLTGVGALAEACV